MSTPIGPIMQDYLGRGPTILVEVDPLVSLDFRGGPDGDCIHSLTLDKASVERLVESLTVAAGIAFPEAK